jgi:hypothetical protein
LQFGSSGRQDELEPEANVPFTPVDPTQFEQANDQENFCQSAHDDAYSSVIQDDSAIEGKFSTSRNYHIAEYHKDDDDDAATPVNPAQFGKPHDQEGFSQTAGPIQQPENTHDGWFMMVIMVDDSLNPSR